MSSNCLRGCISKYATDAPETPQDVEVLTPYVKVTILSRNMEISVGNQSDPSFGNTAIIKSFEFGASNGVTCEIEIVDQLGGSFERFVNAAAKDMNDISKTYGLMSVQYGWITSECKDTTSKLIVSPEMRFSISGIEVNYSEGRIMYKITGHDLMQVVAVSRSDEIFGSDDNKMSLKEAIRKLFEESEPKIKVKFLKRNPNGPPTEDWEFQGGKDQPKDKWACDGQNKLSVAMKWIENFRTESGKGVIPAWDNSSAEPTIIFWEDFITNSQNSSGKIGPFIVNGGSCSNVLSFTPKISWPAAWARFSTGGNSGGAGTGATQEKQNSGIQPEQVGLQTSIATTESGWNVHGPKKAIKEIEKGQTAMAAANSIWTDVKTITAELRIQGNPSEKYTHTITIMGQICSIIVINPFYIDKQAGTECGDWLAKPGCNEVLSNSRWMVKGCAHSIKEGSYVTTLSLFLVAPGTDVPLSSPLGNSSTGYNLSK